MAAWPATLPQIPFAGVTAQDDDAVLRTQMDSGPPTRRNRFTATVQKIGAPMVLSGAEKKDFDFFYRSTLANGSLAFDWFNPADDTIVAMAFAAPPVWVAIGGSADPDQRTWSATLQLEIQP